MSRYFIHASWLANDKSWNDAENHKQEEYFTGSLSQAKQKALELARRFDNVSLHTVRNNVHTCIQAILRTSRTGQQIINY